MSAPAPAFAVVFDLDGVLVDTVELHYAGWLALTRELELPFDRKLNDALRGLGRPESLARVLGDRAAEFDPAARAALIERKNADFLTRVSRLSEKDVAPGADALLAELERSHIPRAVASSSRNARVVLARLELLRRFDAIVDGNDVAASKPDPQVFLRAAERLGVPPARCVAIEDAESGVAAARAAGMWVVGVGPPERVAAAHRVRDRLVGLRLEELRRLVDAPAPQSTL